MNEATNPNLETPDQDMLEEYDFSKAVRGNPYGRITSPQITIETQQENRQVQIKTVEALATVTADGKITLQLPPDITPGEHHVTLLIQEIA
jgi:glutaredoxin